MGDYRPAECWACPVQSRDIPLQWMHYSSASGSLKVAPESFAPPPAPTGGWLVQRYISRKQSIGEEMC